MARTLRVMTVGKLKKMLDEYEDNLVVVVEDSAEFVLVNTIFDEEFEDGRKYLVIDF